MLGISQAKPIFGSWSVTSFVFSKRLGRVASATPDPGTPVTGRP